MKDGREDRFYIGTVCIHLADMLPTKLPRLVFGFQKFVGGRGRSTVPKYRYGVEE